MRTRALAVAVLALASSLLAAPAFAQDPEFDEDLVEPGLGDEIDYARDGFYIQLGYSHAIDRKLENELDENRDLYQKAATDPLGAVHVSSSPGLNVRLGRRVNPYFAIEAQVEYIGDFAVDIGNFGNIQQTATSVTFNLKVPMLTGRFQPFGLLGGGVMFASRDRTYPLQVIPPPIGSMSAAEFEELVDANNIGAVFRVGAGLDIFLTQHVAWSSEFTLVTSQGDDVEDIRYYGLTTGLRYRF